MTQLCAGREDGVTAPPIESGLWRYCRYTKCNTSVVSFECDNASRSRRPLKHSITQSLSRTRSPRYSLSRAFVHMFPCVETGKGQLTSNFCDVMIRTRLRASSEAVDISLLLVDVCYRTTKGDDNLEAGV